MAGLKVVPVKTLADGSLDLEDLKEKAIKHKDNLAAFMVRRQTLQRQSVSVRPIFDQITYPSTFGVFEDGVQEVDQMFILSDSIVILCHRPARLSTRMVARSTSMVRT